MVTLSDLSKEQLLEEIKHLVNSAYGLRWQKMAISLDTFKKRGKIDIHI